MVLVTLFRRGDYLCTATWKKYIHRISPRGRLTYPLELTFYYYHPDSHILKDSYPYLIPVRQSTCVRMRWVSHVISPPINFSYYFPGHQRQYTRYIQHI